MLRVVSILRVVPLLFIAAPGFAQAIRTMEFSSGPRQDELNVTVQYEEPSALHRALGDSRVVPVSFVVRNVSARSVPFDYNEVRLNLGGDAPLHAIDPAVAAKEIRQSRKLPGLVAALGRFSTAFHPHQIDVWLDRQRLKSGSIAPGQTRKGLVFFLRPDGNEGGPGVLWLQTSNWPPQMLETKDYAVWTKPAQQGDFGTRLRRTWQTYFSGTPPAFNKSYALLVGIGRYKHLGVLESPAQDVKKVATYLEAQGFDEIVTITDESVTPETFTQPQKYFKSKLAPEDRFLFYYSGHGMSQMEGERTRGYLPLVDERPGGRARSIAMDQLVAWMKSLSARHLLVILDSCFSGLAVDGTELKGAALEDPTIDRDTLNRLASGRARYLLMAGTAGQQSFGGGRWNGSLFTEMLLKGLRTDADLYRNRIVTARELYVWLKESVYREAQKAQRELTPLFMDLGPVSEGEFIFVQ